MTASLNYYPNCAGCRERDRLMVTIWTKVKGKTVARWLNETLKVKTHQHRCVYCEQNIVARDRKRFSFDLTQVV